ncbi:MAG: elongation factor P [Verrucomicrobia bacterium]|nr:elongation factor P [Verrucomicrobiota bacterium]MBS0645814.1 elongation factor P [Verrucomicrobiota bacterium]
MVTSQQIAPGMTLFIDEKLYRVDSSVKVTLAKGQPFIKTKLRSLDTDKVVEKNFKVGQEVDVVSLEERKLEFLYLEGGSYLFLDDGLDPVLVPVDVVSDKAEFLKEGIELQATFYGQKVFSLDLPQFLELMVAKTDPADDSATLSHATKQAVLETGAMINVPAFVETGDIIKVDTRSKEYVQRV